MPPAPALRRAGRRGIARGRRAGRAARCRRCRPGCGRCASAAAMAERAPTSSAWAAWMAASAAATGRGRATAASALFYARAVIVQLLDGGGAFLGQRLRTRQAAARGVQFALALHHHGLGGDLVALAQGDLRARAGRGVDGLLVLGARLFALGVQGVDLHAGQGLAGLDEGALIDQHVLDAAGQLGRHVDLGGFDAAIAADKALAGTAVVQGAPTVVAEQGHDGDDGQGQVFAGVHLGGPRYGCSVVAGSAASTGWAWVPPPRAAYSATWLDSSARRVRTHCCWASSRSRWASSTSRKGEAPWS